MYTMFRKHFRRKSTASQPSASASASAPSQHSATSLAEESAEPAAAAASTDSLRMSTTATRQRQRPRQREFSSLPSPISDCGSLKSACNLIALILILLVHKISAAGNFELEILEISNTNSHLLSGYCCGMPPELRATKTTGCSPCTTAFRLCLKEYQTTEQGASISTGCSFGNSTTKILGSSSFVLSDPGVGAIVLPFTFRWTKSFTLILQALDMYNTSYPDAERLIEETSYSGVILPSPEWKTLDHIGRNARITYRVRVQCAVTYYNTTCTTFCRPRDDQFGHYACGSEGQKLCLNGWQGVNCEEAICKTGCDPVHGKCDRPGECECRPGWRGPLCNECMVYPGCKHGSCNGSAWKCVCDTNWGGILCDQDLNYCGTHEPCKHGGTCENTAPDQYRCTCAEGLSGEQCEIVEHPCATQPCRNGGTCTLKPMNATRPPVYRIMRGMSTSMGRPISRRNSIRSLANLRLESQNGSTGGALGSSPGLPLKPLVAEFTCGCAAGWTGPTCEINIDECAGGPCEHGGTCVDLIGGFRCECPPEWRADVCQLDVNECEVPHAAQVGAANTLLTTTASAVIGSNLSSSAALLAALTSAVAASNAASTIGPCINARACINEPGSFSCECLEGWGGATCAENLDDCVGQCKNGASCIDLVNDYRCACRTGYTGRDCETDIDECAASPCRNGGECVDMIGKFNCICPLGYSGSLCEEAKDHCTPSPCLQGRCLNTPGSYYCHCPPDRAGKHCEQLRPLCSQPPCNEGCFANVTGMGTGTGIAATAAAGTTTKTTTTTTTMTTPSGLPCSGHGSCEMSDVGTFCKCHVGHTGTFCEHNLNECSPNPCRNGGICLDGDGDFTCECMSGWTGKRCSERATGCYAGQCQNGGTCMPGAPDKALQPHCRCAPGWTGLFCAESIDQCRGQPCHNGGTCESGAGWFRCLCAQGFSGPDCRINVNECSPQPCQGGATCIDGIGGYSCICPAGRHGLRCEILLSDPKSACLNASNTISPYAALNQSQNWLDTALSGRSEDDEHCNACVCENGTSRCTNLWCGLPNCYKLDPLSKSSNLSGVCKLHEVCVPALSETCLSPPCNMRGDCRALEPSRRVAPPSLPAKASCWPNQALVNENCARLTILLDLERVGRGASVEGLCSLVRVLLAAQLVKLEAPNAPSQEQGLLMVLCDLKSGSNDTIELTVSSSKLNDPQLPVAVALLGELLSSRQLNGIQRRKELELQHAKLAALTSILEVKLETARVADGSGHSLLIGVLCGVFIVLVGFSIFISLYWKQRLAYRSSSGMNLTPSLDALRHEEEKSNNLQNEENLRRYTNPLKGSTSSLRATTGMELSLNPAPELAASAASGSALHRSQPLFPPCDFERELDSSTGLKQAHKRGSQILLHKTQNLDMKKNTVGSLDSPRKDFGKRSINCKSLPPPACDIDGVDVLTTVMV
ncbi:protein serrate isoform X2 [Drosophila subobscura]|uniref:protein serrate isoform X2 n=1 Tax=Drosophila subobscura TaxID=7241 RepID=UPI00155A1981|nr:protein serrate isoform X2 [Drosophila subobscura]